MPETGSGGPSPEEMGMEPKKEEQELAKIELSEDDKEMIGFEIESVADVAQDVINVDEFTALADAADAMELLNDTLGNNPTYQALRKESVEASKMAMEAYKANDPIKIKEAAEARKAWAEKLKGLIA